MAEREKLPKPQKDFPLPEKEIPAHAQTAPFLKSKWLIPVVLIASFIFGLSAYLLLSNNANQQVACTLEAKLCPDGSSVGRTGPKCEFSPCPTSNATDADETANWKTYADHKYTFKYPPDWALEDTIQTREFIKRLSNKNQTVSITFSETQSPYGFGADMGYENNVLNINFGGKTYKVIESKNLSKAFVDFKTDIPNVIHILFGTGYPAANDATASLSDYYAERENILKIISTFKFTDSTSIDTSVLKTFTSQKLKDNSTSGYTLRYPDDWNIKEERTTEVLTSTVNISNNGYSINIYQAPMGGGGCIYEGDVPEGPYSDLRGKPYVDVEAGFGSVRRTENDAQTGSAYSFCQKNKEYGSYGSPTSIGAISYTAPTNPDSSILTEMDNIIKSITAI